MGRPVPPCCPLADQESLYVGGVGWASTALEYETNQLPGASYSIQGANAIDYLVDELGVAEGDSVGVVYFVGDYGNDALAGAEYAAEERGVTVDPAGDHPANTDLSAQASALVQEGVSAVVLAAAPAQLASLAGVLASQGADIPIMGMNPTFNPVAAEHAGRGRPAGQRATASPASRPTPRTPRASRRRTSCTPKPTPTAPSAGRCRWPTPRPSCCAPPSRGPARPAT